MATWGMLKTLLKKVERTNPFQTQPKLSETQNKKRSTDSLNITRKHKNLEKCKLS